MKSPARAALVYALVAALTAWGCGDSDEQGFTTASGTNGTGEGCVASEADASEGESPEGSPCELVGHFESCTVCDVAGRSYCDSIDGELRWGRCLTSWTCEIGQYSDSCESCELQGGEPTFVPVDDPYCYGQSSGETPNTTETP